MNILATIGQEDTAVRYTDRPTVKVIIKNDNKVLILNKGLLPGGGIDRGSPIKMQLLENCKRS